MNEPPVEGKWYWVWVLYIREPLMAQRGHGAWWDATNDTVVEDEIVSQWEPIPPPTIGAPKGKEQAE